MLAEPFECPRASNALTSLGFQPSLEVVLYKANPTSGGVTASTEMLAAKRHARVLAPVIVGKMIIANQQMAYAA
jgi:acetyl-CoA carboxylase beta subunit